MKQTVVQTTTQAVPKPIVCAKPKAPAKAPLKFDATTQANKVPEKGIHELLTMQVPMICNTCYGGYGPGGPYYPRMQQM